MNLLGQPVLLSLLLHLSLDINKDTPLKLAWMTEVGLAIDTSDPTIVSSFSPAIFEQVSKEILNLSESNRYLTEVRVLKNVIRTLQLACK